MRLHHIFGAALAVACLLAVAHPTSAERTPSHGTATTFTDPVSSRLTREGSWYIEESANFRVCWHVNQRIEPRPAARMERLRSELRRSWLAGDDADTEAWQPKCHVVLHAHAESYLNEVGRGASSTLGSSAVEFDQGRVRSRRIDLRGDRADWFAAALAHELTHVVLADRFAHTRIPHWADEGMAIHADPHEKRVRHARGLHSAVAARREFRLGELLTHDGYPQPSRMATFYDQSASLVHFLTQIGTQQQLVDFVDHATRHGYDRALSETYGIASVGELEQRWRAHLGRQLTHSQ